MSGTAMSFLTQTLNGKIGLHLWSSDENCNTIATTTFWLDPTTAAGLGKMLLKEVDRLPRVVEASDLGIAA